MKKSKDQNHRLNLKINTTGFFLLFFFCNILLLTSPVFGQTPSPTGTLRDSVRQKVAEELAQIRQGVAKKAFVGSIASLSEASFTLTTVKSQTRNVTFSPETTIRISNQDGTMKDLKSGQFIIVMGDVDSQNQMTAKRLLVITKPATDKRRSILGTVTRISSSSLTVETGGESWTVKISSTTNYNGSTKLSDIDANEKIVAVGTSEGDKTLAARHIHLLP